MESAGEGREDYSGGKRTLGEDKKVAGRRKGNDEERLMSWEKEGENVDGMETREGGGVARCTG